MTLSFNSSFVPAWWCRNPHLQTLWPYFFRFKPRPVYRRERLELPDGDFIDLDWVDGAAHSPIVVILHGLGGSSESHYIRGLATHLHNTGFRCVVAQHRGCSGEPNRLPRSYHAGATADLNTALEMLHEREPHTCLFAVGYSLGGNMLLKWLHDHPFDSTITAAAVISAPLVLTEGAERMQRGLSRIYQWRLILLLKRSLRQKFSRITCPIDLNQLHNVHRFWDFDDMVTARLHGFRDVNEYYSQCSARQFLSNIRTPTLLIHAADDPLLTESVVPATAEISPAVHFELSKHGGHCGFVSGFWPGMAIYWAEKRISRYFTDSKDTDRYHLGSNICLC